MGNVKLFPDIYLKFARNFVRNFEACDELIGHTNTKICEAQKAGK